MAIILGLASLACGVEGVEAPPRHAAPLVSHQDWSLAGAEDDPFSDRPRDPTCDPAGIVLEDEVLEVSTGLCGYVTLVQPSRVPIEIGDRLDGFLWHLNLSAPEPAIAHAALQIGDREAWSLSIPIPRPESLYDQDWIATSAFPVGTPIYFHLHNHGSNSWRLGPLKDEPVEHGDEGSLP